MEYTNHLKLKITGTYAKGWTIEFEPTQNKEIAVHSGGERKRTVETSDPYILSEIIINFLDKQEEN